MEECEALCSSVAIMVGGRFRCHGNIQRLKARYGQGFTVDLKLNAETNMVDQAERIASFFYNKFPNTRIIEKSTDHMVFRLQQANLSVANVFASLEDNKVNLGILEYSVSQTTLEQIFNSFASQQEEEKVVAPGMAGNRTTADSIEMLSISATGNRGPTQ